MLVRRKDDLGTIGDQTGNCSIPGLKVKRVPTPAESRKSNIRWVTDFYSNAVCLWGNPKALKVSSPKLSASQRSNSLARAIQPSKPGLGVLARHISEQDSRRVEGTMPGADVVANACGDHNRLILQSQPVGVKALGHQGVFPHEQQIPRGVSRVSNRADQHLIVLTVNRTHVNRTVRTLGRAMGDCQVKEMLAVRQEKGQRWLLCLLRSTVVTGTGTRRKQKPGKAEIQAKTITSPLPHAPPRPLGASQREERSHWSDQSLQGSVGEKAIERLSATKRKKTLHRCREELGVGRIHGTEPNLPLPPARPKAPNTGRPGRSPGALQNRFQLMVPQAGTRQDVCGRNLMRSDIDPWTRWPQGQNCCKVSKGGPFLRPLGRAQESLAVPIPRATEVAVSNRALFASDLRDLWQDTSVRCD